MENDTYPVQMFKVEAYVLYFNGETSKEEIKMDLENSEYFSVHVKQMEETALIWNDEHPLNKTTASTEKYRSYFRLPDTGDIFVDRPMRPKTELELENEKLRNENEILKSKINSVLQLLK
jgi:hypothetical protein